MEGASYGSAKGTAVPAFKWAGQPRLLYPGRPLLPRSLMAESMRGADHHVRGGKAGQRSQRAAATKAEQSQWGRKGGLATFGGTPPVKCELCGAVLYYWPHSEKPPGDPLDEAAEAIAAHLRHDHGLALRP